MDGIVQSASLYSSYFNQKDGLNKNQINAQNASKNPPSFNARQELLAIASAHNQAQVKRIIGRLGIKLNQAKKFSSNSNTARQIKVVMEKGSEKIKNLKIEEKKAKQIALAKRQQEIEKAKQQEEELRLRKTNRKAKELSDVKNADTSGDSNGIAPVSLPTLSALDTQSASGGNVNILTTSESISTDSTTSGISV